MLTLSIAGAAGTMSAGRSAVASAPRRAADDSPELQAAVTWLAVYRARQELAVAAAGH